MSSPNNTPLADSVEQETRRKYSGAFYQPATAMRRGDQQESDYFGRVLGRKLSLVERFTSHRRVLDLCCATGEHLFQTPESASLRVGLDFSLPFLRKAKAEIAVRDEGSCALLCGNARRLPFATASFGLVYSFSALYYVPQVGEALAEIARILEPEGVAIIELGNLLSLNTLVCRAHSETAMPCHQRIAEMKRMLRSAPFEILEHHAFQLLPLWGERPKWLKPLLHPFWKRAMERQIAGQMLDEWLCRLPGFRQVAFRHLFACRRGRQAP